MITFKTDVDFMTLDKTDVDNIVNILRWCKNIFDQNIQFLKMC